MMRKLLTALVLFILITPGFAFGQQRVILEVEGRYWFTELEGSMKVEESGFGTDIDFVEDLDIKDENYPEIRVTWYTGPKSKIRAAYTEVNYEGDENLERTVQFAGETYPAGTRVITDVDMKYLRVGWAWQFINLGGVVKLGTLIEAKVFRFDGSLDASNFISPISESERFTFGLPTIGVALDINPHKMVNIFAEGSGLPAGSYGYVYDAEVGIKFIPVRIFSIIGGYRIMEFKAENDDDFAKIRIHGPFVGLTIRF
jgi:hypothetical protein